MDPCHPVSFSLPPSGGAASAGLPRIGDWAAALDDAGAVAQVRQHLALPDLAHAIQQSDAYLGSELYVERYHAQVASGVLLGMAPPADGHPGLKGTNDPDPLTRSLFVGESRIIFAPRTEPRIGDKLLSAHDMMRLSTAPTGSEIRAEFDKNVGRLVLTANHPLFKEDCLRSLGVDSSGAHFIENVNVALVRNAPKATFLRALALQVQQAHHLGFAYLKTYAAGDANHNGAYTMPRYGFNAELSERQKARLPDSCAEVQDLLTLMSSPAGRAYWKANYETKTVRFDLDPSSASWRTLEAVMQEKDVRLPRIDPRQRPE